jgi:hypothetical protein
MQDSVPRRKQRSSRMVLQRQQRRSLMLSLQESVHSSVIVRQYIHHPVAGGETELRRTY